MRLSSAVLALVLGTGSASAAGVDPAAPPAGKVLFVKKGALWSVIPDGKAAPQELATLPESIGTPTWLSTSRDGNLVVVQGDKGAAWRTAAAPDWRTDCAGHAQPAPDGDAILCETAGQARLFDPTKPADPAAATIAGAREANFWGGPKALVVLSDDGVMSFQVGSPKKRKKLAKAGPLGNLEVAPDGTQAVAVFGQGTASRIEIFMLDGDGVPRRLGGPGIPLGWSWDSTWVLIEEGNAPSPAGGGSGDDGGDDDGGGGADEGGGEGLWLGGNRPWIGAGTPSWFGVTKKAVPGKGKKATKGKKAARREAAAAAKFGDGGKINVRACVARATGGETKCWNGYSPRGISPESQRVLLFKDGTLSIGKLAGVRPEPPRKLLDGVSGPATWIP